MTTRPLLSAVSPPSSRLASADNVSAIEDEALRPLARALVELAIQISEEAQQLREEERQAA